VNPYRAKRENVTQNFHLRKVISNMKNDLTIYMPIMINVTNLKKSIKIFKYSQG